MSFCLFFNGSPVVLQEDGLFLGCILVRPPLMVPNPENQCMHGEVQKFELLDALTTFSGHCLRDNSSLSWTFLLWHDFYFRYLDVCRFLKVNIGLPVAETQRKDTPYQ